MCYSNRYSIKTVYTAVRRQKTLTVSSEVVQGSDFSNATYNSVYVSDVQSLMAKVLCNNFFIKIFGHKIEMLGEIWNIQKNAL